MTTRSQGKEPRGGSTFHRLSTFVASIRTRFFLVNAFLVLVPLAGLSFARTYERELLRSEEDGMVAIARTLAAVAAADLDDGNIRLRGALPASVDAAARDLKAQVRVLDAEGKVLTDTGAEEVTKQTRGRALLRRVPEGGSIRSVLPEERSWSRVPAASGSASSAGVPEEPGTSSYADAPEVKKALGGASGRFTRVPSEFRGVRLYVAEPVRHEGRVVGVVYVSRTTYPVLVALYRARDGLYRVAALSLLFAVGIAAILGFTIARPLRQLGEAANRIARGERGVSLRMKGKDEIADLARAFDRMSHELDARLAYISELSANVSHELKTPIASIRGSAELLRDGAADDPVARDRFLGHILTDTERMTRLVSRLLELSRIEASDRVRLPCDYRALVEEEIDGLRESGKPVTLTWSSDASHVRGLPDHLSAALHSLLENALRHGGEQGVAVHVEREGDLLRTDVVDHGSGISQANLVKIWERFFTTERATGGTGIGLSLVRAVVEAHGGTVHVVSSPGEGAVFSFRLPLLVARGLRPAAPATCLAAALAPGWPAPASAPPGTKTSAERPTLGGAPPRRPRRPPRRARRAGAARSRGAAPALEARWPGGSPVRRRRRPIPVPRSAARRAARLPAHPGTPRGERPDPIRRRPRHGAAARGETRGRASRRDRSGWRG